MKALLAAVILGGAFGMATATVESVDDDVMVVELQVEVLDAAESVVAHLSFDGEPDVTLPLLEREASTFGTRTELEPKNYVVVFETVGEAGQRSEPTTLAQLGADLGPEASVTTTSVDDDGLSEESQQFLWLAVALGAASLSLLAFWVLGGRDDDNETGEATDAVPEAEEE